MPRHRWRVRRAGRTRCRRAHWRSAHRVQELARPARGAAVVFGCSGAGRVPTHECGGGHQRRPGSAGVGRTPGAAGGRGAWHRLQRRGGPAVAAGAVGALGDHGGGSARSAGTQRPAPAPAGQAGLVRPGTGRGPDGRGPGPGCAGGQFAGSGGGPGRRLTPDRGAGACLSRRPHPPHGGAGTGASIGPWLLRPTAGHARSMLRLFVGPGEDPPETDVEWMTLMAASCRSTLAPPPLPAGLLARRAGRPCVVGTGEHDRFLRPGGWHRHWHCAGPWTSTCGSSPAWATWPTRVTSTMWCHW